MLAFTKKVMSIAYIIIETTSLIGLESHSAFTRFIPPKRMAALITPINAPPAMKPEANSVPFSPRAALTADKIASRAEFFSFGTNDLTQMTFGYSRDDIASFLPIYLEKKILKVDPFQVLDQNGVGQLIRMATEKGRAVRPDLKCGICGEHGGEPSSVKFCHKVGLNYVSCSPFRVPIARLAAAQAAIEEA